MIKSIFKTSFVLLLFFVSKHLQAQNYFGVRAGVNFATVSTTKDGSITNKLILGGNGVVYFDFNLGKKRRMGIQPEFALIQKGFLRSLPNSISGSRDITYRFNYYNFSLLYKYKFGDKKGIRGYAALGPFLGKLFSGKSRWRNNQDKKESKKIDLKKYNKTSYGITLGGGIVFPIRSVKFIIDLRIGIGILELDHSVFDSGSIRNRGINLSVGYAFPLGARYYRP